MYDQNNQLVVLSNAFQVLSDPYGCTDPTATNYNSSATIDDGSCCFGVNFNETYTFTNCGQTGRFGPSQSQINAAYSGTSLDGNVISNSGIQEWVVPNGVTSIYIEAYGAEGGSGNEDYHSPGGKGAKMSGDFLVTPGETLSIVVGQKGYSGAGGSGGGGSFVWKNTGANLLLAAGGGGGAGDPDQGGIDDGMNGVTSSFGTNSASGNGIGGSNGSGGGSSNSGGGGGWLTNGINGMALDQEVTLGYLVFMEVLIVTMKEVLEVGHGSSGYRRRAVVAVILGVWWR